jgi:hypothetical protein
MIERPTAQWRREFAAGESAVALIPNGARHRSYALAIRR